jgi:putative hemolysin
MQLRSMMSALSLAAATGLLPATAAHAGDNGHCAATGGAPTKVHPFSNTNADAPNWVAYGGSAQACTYTDANGASITAWASTLSSKKPTMAALAYYAKVPWDGQGSGNPAALYCIQIGGTQVIGALGSGSGWATEAGGARRSMCMFADMSAIDDWGLLYHANDVIRGKDLATVFRFPNPY